MQDLKITFHMKSPVILDRTTTIDGIILSSYYAYSKEKGKVMPFDKEHKTVDFIHKENGVFSGSIWYIDKNADISFDFETFVKKSEHRKLFDATKKKKTSDALFKAFLGTDETMLVDKLYFYIKAKKAIVKKLLIGKAFALGKKQSVGFGMVKNIEIEEINEDKGFLLNDTTPSKPLPVKDFSVNSKKIAQMRRMPPYWLEEDLEPCYMPTTALYELKDKSYNEDKFLSSIEDYEHNCNFLYKHSLDKKEIKFKDIPMSKILKKISVRNSKTSWVENNKDLKCSITGNISKKGISSDIKSTMIRLKSSFSDYDSFNNNDFLSKEALWCIENISEIAYSYVDKKSWLYLQGKNAKDGTRYKDFILNPKMLKPPFSINLKDTQNAQHVSFKGKVSISNAYFIVQYGNTQLYIDNELLQQAIKDIANITADNKIKKIHLCGNFDKNKSSHISLKREYDNMQNVKIILDFQKQYNSHIRLLLNSVKLD